MGCVRIIPALAGSTQAGHARDCISTDHPRVGGEHELVPEEVHPSRGSSPRWRGALMDEISAILHKRIIPALAWSTDCFSGHDAPFADHPRVGGEHDTHVSRHP